MRESLRSLLFAMADPLVNAIDHGQEEHYCHSDHDGKGWRRVLVLVVLLHDSASLCSHEVIFLLQAPKNVTLQLIRAHLFAGCAPGQMILVLIHFDYSII